MTDKTSLTPGEALFEFDRPLADYPNRRPWSALDQTDRDRFEHRALDVLELADAIREKLK